MKPAQECRASRALIVGWFSFEEMGATAGDLIAAALVRDWLREAGCDDVSTVFAPPFGADDWRTWRSSDLDTVVFVCGPFGNGWPVTEFLEHFASSRLVGVDLTMLQAVADWNPFELLLERDSDRACRPDITFIAPPSDVPIIGVVKVHPQEEYGERGRHDHVHRVIDDLTAGTPGVRLEIDTRLDRNTTGLRSAAEVEALIARCDVVITTRLHGTVLSLKNGVPPLVIDPIAGGDKVLRQARTVAWPYAYTVEELPDVDLRSVIRQLLSPTAKQLASRCGDEARAAVGSIRQQFIETLSTATSSAAREIT